jgi:hypothetical protein
MIIPSEYNQQTVALADIRSETSPFRITTNSDIDDLAGSFKRVGIINPPVLLPEGNSYIVVCGHRRVQTAHSLSWETLTARILPTQDNPLRCVCLAISENSIERPLNLIETSRAFLLLKSVIPDTRERYKVAGDLGLPSNPSIIQKIEPLCRLPENIQNGILSGGIALSNALMLSKLPSKTADSLSAFLIKLKLSLNKQRELIEIIKEISIIEECEVDDILQTEDIQCIMDHPEMDIPRKAGLIRNYLKRRRFPHISNAMDSFQNLKKSLSLGENVFLKPPPGFESNQYHITFSFSDVSELKRHKQTLERLLHDDRIRGLFDPETYHMSQGPKTT